MNRWGIDIGRVIIDGSSGLAGVEVRAAIHCVDLAITHFVDDKPDVIAAITPVVPHRYLFKNWTATETAFLRDLDV